MSNSIYNKTLVVDSAYIARTITSSTRAFTINYKGNAEIVYEHPQYFKLVDDNLKIKKPSVFRLIFAYL